MSGFLTEIREIDSEAASILDDANIRTDSDIQFLSRQDLHDLFPGIQQFRRRKIIFDIKHKQKPVDVRDFIPHESLRAALTGNSVLVDHLHILKNMKSQMDNVQTFLDAHISLLEDISKSGSNQELQNGSKLTTSATAGPVMLDNNQPHEHQQGANGSTSTTSATAGPVMRSNNQPHERQQGTYRSTSTTSVTSGQGKPDKIQTNPQRPLDFFPDSTVPSHVSAEKGSYVRQTVKYQAVVSGQTFGAHVQLMDNIKAPSLNRKLQLVENDQDPQIIFVFCPIVSRLATDANAALEDVKVSTGKASIILVLMHHVHEVKCVTHLRTWDENQNVVLHVHVFYHEKVHGLLRCKENRDAVSQIQSQLLEMHPCKYISADAQDESSMTDSFAGGGDNSDAQNDDDNNSGSFRRRVSQWWAERTYQSGNT